MNGIVIVHADVIDHNVKLFVYDNSFIMSGRNIDLSNQNANELKPEASQ